MASVDCIQHFVERINSIENKLHEADPRVSLSCHLSLMKSLCDIATKFDADFQQLLADLKALLCEVKGSAGQDGSVKLDYELIKNGCRGTAEKCERATQTDNLESQTLQETEQSGTTADWQPPEGSDVTVADLVKQAAEDALANTDYVYNEEYQMYYSLSSGYYYDPVSHLFYEPHSGTYYSYDAESQTYQFHSRVEPTTDANKRKKRPKKPKKRKRYRSWSEDDDEIDSLEEGEVDSSGCASNESESEPEEEHSKSYPPCIRFVVKESDQLQLGSIVMVTYPGATVGQLQSCGLCIPDTSVSKNHAEITFNETTATYELRDVGSRNHTFINNVDIEKDATYPLGHLDTVKFGTCVLQAHIHERMLTCGHCEPGLLQADVAAANAEPHAVTSKQDREKQRRAELKRIKKKYSLENVDYVEAKSSSTKGYTDRAQVRRDTVGSKFPHERDADPSSVDRVLPTENKGFQMLQKMGWKEGEGLGKQNQGTTEPVVVEQRKAHAGLGAEDSSSLNPKSEVWRRTKERYDALT
ncbi:angiogenic factor with G patch and FHA domains 1-like isoform X1 [Ornithodoros turicata]|uniref:angiogenic factor with G patch and FHA domains 1-like isoform X1 n=1 Tax=Ornithodoros turicata TaxID=34597 RepID=UPI00313986C5